MNNFEKLGTKLLKVQKPARYTGGEVNSVIKPNTDNSIELSTVFCFPDTYEIGMSHLGLKILYSLINSRDEYRCERCFMPLPDMTELMRENGVKLYGLESKMPLDEFDVVAFTLQYELSYTTILAMLELGGVPVLRAERGESSPLVIAGGPCACNPQPLLDFIDIFVIGEGEEVTLELLDLYNDAKKKGVSRREFLALAGEIEGVYVSGFKRDKPVRKRFVKDLDSIFYPKEFIVPFIDTVHDRAVTEVLRGCIRGCRFCQAGFICRPYREKSRSVILNETESLCEKTGYDEISLCSLSTSDHSDIDELLRSLTDYTDDNSINLSLPSIRIDKFTDEMLKRIKSVRKSSLTFAPEAGTQRLRDVINKNITEEDILQGCKVAFRGGYSTVKLYFMLGLPTETDDDILGIHRLVEKIMRLYKEYGPNRAISVSISFSTFVPKPFTPFQYEPMITREEADRRQKLLMSCFAGKSRKVKISRSKYDSSFLEAVFARGDAELGKVIYTAYKSGCVMDSWDDYFDFSKWEAAFEVCKYNAVDIVGRRRDYDEVLPWSDIDMLVSADFLISENKLAYKEVTTPNCRERCSGCGVRDCEGIRV